MGVPPYHHYSQPPEGELERMLLSIGVGIGLAGFIVGLLFRWPLAMIGGGLVVAELGFRLWRRLR